MQACRLATLLKKRLWNRSFPVNFCENCKNTSGRVLLQWFNFVFKSNVNMQVHPLWSPIKKLSWNTSWKCSSLRSTFLWFSFQLFHANLDPPPVIKRYKVRKNTQIFYNISNFLKMFQMSYICNQVAILAYKVLIKKHIDY